MAETPDTSRAAIEHMLLTSQNLTLGKLVELERSVKQLTLMLKTIVELLEAKTTPPAPPVASYGQLYADAEEDPVEVDVLPAERNADNDCPDFTPRRFWHTVWRQYGWQLSMLLLTWGLLAGLLWWRGRTP